MHQPLVLRKNMANRINVFTVLPYDEHTTYGISIETTTTIPLQQKASITSYVSNSLYA